MAQGKRKLSDFSAEIAAHLELEVERLMGEGLSHEQAQAAARRAFGNVMRAEERFYETRRWPSWDHCRQDVRYAIRTLRRHPALPSSPS